MKMITERLKFAEVFPDKAASVAQRLHIKKDEIPFVRKYYTAEKDKTEVKKKERAVISYISTGIKDRDGEKLVPEGVVLENYQKNPIVPFAHDYRTIPPAKNMWIKQDEKGLIAKTVFAKNQRAEDIYQAYTEDVGGTGPLLNAWSVGFIPIEWEDTDKKAMEKDPELPKRIYNKWELLEYSAVPIPSCPEALTIAVEKNLIPEGLKKDLEVEVVKDEKDRAIEIIKNAIEAEKEGKETMEEAVKRLKEQDVEYVKRVDEEEEKKRDKEIEVEKDEGEIVEHDWLDEYEDGIEEWNIEKQTKTITKPETTDNYHRIPVNAGCKITATITISAKQGIKALYCGEEKKVHTYLFDVKKWTMEEAKKWVQEHKSVLGRFEKRLEEREMEANIVEIDDLLQVDPEELIEEMALETGEEDVIVEIDELLQEVKAEELQEDDREIEVEADERQEKFNCECIKCGHKLTSDKHCNEIKCPECGGEMRRTSRPGPGREFDPKALHVDVNLADIKEWQELMSNMQEELRLIKEGRVLSRKNRGIVKDAIVALQAVLKADATGTQEDEEGETGTVTERDIEVIRDGKQEFSKEDIVRVVKEVSGEQMGDILTDAFKNALDPEKIKAMVSEGIRLELAKLRGKVE